MVNLAVNLNYNGRKRNPSFDGAKNCVAFSSWKSRHTLCMWLNRSAIRNVPAWRMEMQLVRSLPWTVLIAKWQRKLKRKKSISVCTQTVAGASDVISGTDAEDASLDLVIQSQSIPELCNPFTLSWTNPKTHNIRINDDYQSRYNGSLSLTNEWPTGLVIHDPFDPSPAGH